MRGAWAGTYNHWETAEYLEVMEGQGEVDYWELEGYIQYVLDASASFRSTGSPIGVYRAETTVTGEVFGDFHTFKEYQAVVDSYSRAGVSTYDTVGGASAGQNPIAYPNGGSRSVARGPGPSTGYVENVQRMRASIKQTFSGSMVTYYVYARGKQYYHNQGVEEVSLATAYSHIPTTPPWPVPGWAGVLRAYDSNGILIAEFPMAE